MSKSLKAGVIGAGSFGGHHARKYAAMAGVSLAGVFDLPTALFVAGSGCVGTATVSGLPQREDHAMLIELIAPLCGVALAEVALD